MGGQSTRPGLPGQPRGGDPLTYSLETAPPGMVIDKTSGRIVWQVPPGIQGSHRVRVVVRDNHQGQGFQEFDLDFAPRS
ncbi:MAG: Ig domain-containing protein [Nitrospiraceae bacterium]